jgi:uncharacterized protein Yka (UPF0111/DUF47 family)
MFSFLKSNPKKKLETQHAQLLEKAVEAQRNGKIELYGQIMTKAEELLKEIEKIEQNEKANSASR